MTNLTAVLRHCFSTIAVCTWFLCSVIKAENDRPIIGVMAEQVINVSKHGNSYISASYVKYLESAGARVVPIMIYQPVSYYEDILHKINGVLLPGGGDILRSEGYGRTGKIIFDLAVKLNQNNNYFPLWGTCLGFELMNYVPAGKLWMRACSQLDKVHSIKLQPSYKSSKMFKDIEPRVKNVMEKKDVAYHFHRWCLTPENFTVSGLDKYYRVLALNNASDHGTFISAIEAYNYPFYGVAFHPEKVLFEWVVSETFQNIPHNFDSVKVSQYFANFFVNEARKSFHRFPSKAAEDAALIYNFTPIFTGKFNSSTEIKYYFNVTKV